MESIERLISDGEHAKASPPNESVAAPQQADAGLAAGPAIPVVSVPLFAMPIIAAPAILPLIPTAHAAPVAGAAPTAATSPAAHDDDDDEESGGEQDHARHDAPPLPLPLMFGGIPQLPRPLPRVKPVIVPERTEKGCRTAGVVVERAGGGSCYIIIHPEARPSQTIYATRAAFTTLLDIAGNPQPDPGRLWRALSSIPLEKPLPNRQLEEELRTLLSSFAPDLRR